MEGESILKVLASDPAQGLKDAVLFGAHLSVPIGQPSRLGRALRARAWARETTQAIVKDYIESGHDAGVPAQPRLRPDHPARRPAREALRPPGRAEHRCAQAPDRGQPAPGGQHRQEVHRSRHELPGPHPGGEHRPHPGGREVRLREGLQVQHVRHVVDPAGDHARHRRPGAHDPHPGPHGRDDQPPDPGQPHPAPGARARADGRGDRSAHEPRRGDPRAARQAPARADRGRGRRARRRGPADRRARRRCARS